MWIKINLKHLDLLPSSITTPQRLYDPLVRPISKRHHHLHEYLPFHPITVLLHLCYISVTSLLQLCYISVASLLHLCCIYLMRYFQSYFSPLIMKNNTIDIFRENTKYYIIELGEIFFEKHQFFAFWVFLFDKSKLKISCFLYTSLQTSDSGKNTKYNIIKSGEIFF